MSLVYEISNDTVIPFRRKYILHGKCSGGTHFVGYGAEVFGMNVRKRAKIVLNDEHVQNTLVIFDRFSLENANTVIFSKSGAGKSYAAKLEALRLLMTGTDVIIIDPEHEYKALAEAAGGSFVSISLASQSHINPFDLPAAPEGEAPDDVLKSHIVTLAGLIKIMVGKISAEEEAISKIRQDLESQKRQAIIDLEETAQEMSKEIARLMLASK